MKKRIVVAMSGGVDSSVAAALLKARGFEVVGITMCFNIGDYASRRPNCCGLQGIEDARRVAYKLGIKHYVVNMKSQLKQYVIDDFIKEYSAGRTPNPCVLCNQHLKFGALLKKAISLGAGYLATGHYAKIAKTRNGYLLRKAKDLYKDQSYFLYRLNQNQLKHILFPLGNYTKEEVRKLAHKFGLAVADKPGSQEICFLPQGDYRDFLKKHISKEISEGIIVDTGGSIIGKHKGVAFYTIGQREGLRVACGYPVYVSQINPNKNQITLGKKEDIYKGRFLVKEPNFILKPPKKIFTAGVRIRYNHKEERAQVVVRKGKLVIYFRRPQFAITPGQSAVLYQNNTVLGGGIIERVLD